ncbi:hypothetical protein [Sphingomonas sp. GM_Shp_2]|uniref:hypothetical protein n=1 Tax=unclassified Sphingomonas TaxID=196159 RepID=UPI00226A6D02|nr:hypothetical protein [Sphingomonas sp. GM_Shp_2]
MSKIDNKMAEIQDTISASPDLKKSMMKWAALGAVVAIPLPFTMPLGAVAGATYAYWKRKKG